MAAVVTAALAASEVVRSFDHPAGPVRVLDALDLRVWAGELVTISGPSGSGKSALLSILCGFDRPDSGRVSLLGAPMTSPPPWRHCAILPQAMGLLGELTLVENVQLPLRLGGGIGDIDRRALGLLAELGIHHLAQRYPAEVSFGQRQRAALARAVAGSPDVLLADEPTAHLDHASTPAVLKLLRRTAHDGAAVLITTHDQRVHAIGDRLLELSGGKLTEATSAA